MNAQRTGVLIVAVMCLGFSGSSRAAVYQVSWFTVEGGGAVGTQGGNFELSGAIAQHDAGPGAPGMTGGAWELTGGFWTVASVPASCKGDANGDGTVDPLDAGFVQARFGCVVGEGGAECDMADQNQDGVVDPLDVGFVLARLGSACGG